MQITLTPAGIAAANAANMSGLTITISKFRVYRSNVAEVSLPYVTTGLEDLTTLAAWTWLPAATEFTTLEEFEPLDPNTVQLVCKLDETVGDFDYDILTLWLADGTFFGLAANRFLWKKFQAGNPPANQHKIHVSFTFTNAAATTNINIDNAKWSFDFIPEVNSVDDLVKAGLAIHRMYRCTRRMGTGDDATGVRSFLVQSGKAAFDAQSYQRNEWIPSDYRLVYSEDLLPTVDTHLSNVAFQKDVSRVVFKFNTNGAYNAAQLSSLDPKSVILSMAYPDGTNQGLLRHVSSISVLSDGSGVWVALDLLTPLPNIPTSYVPVKVYTCQTDRQIPAPSAAGKLLTSTQADVGYGHTWEDPTPTFVPVSTLHSVEGVRAFTTPQGATKATISFVAPGGGGGGGGGGTASGLAGAGGAGGNAGARGVLEISGLLAGDVIELENGATAFGGSGGTAGLGAASGTNGNSGGFGGPSIIRVAGQFDLHIPGGFGGSGGIALGSNPPAATPGSNQPPPYILGGWTPSTAFSGKPALSGMTMTKSSLSRLEIRVSHTNTISLGSPSTSDIQSTGGNGGVGGVTLLTDTNTGIGAQTTVSSSFLGDFIQLGNGGYGSEGGGGGGGGGGVVFIPYLAALSSATGGGSGGPGGGGAMIIRFHV